MYNNEKYFIGQVIDTDAETQITKVQSIFNEDEYALAVDINNAQNYLKSHIGSIGYFVELNKNNDGKWVIISQSKDLCDLENSNATTHRLLEAKKRHKSNNKKISIVFGKESGIDTFHRKKGTHKKGYAKHITDCDSSQKNGYGLKGDFISLTMSKETILEENELYIDCTRGETYKDDIFHLFTVKNDTVVLISTANRIKDLWDDIESFLKQKQGVTNLTLWSAISQLTTDKNKLQEFAMFLNEYCRSYNNCNSVEDFEKLQLIREMSPIQPTTEV